MTKKGLRLYVRRMIYTHLPVLLFVDSTSARLLMWPGYSSDSPFNETKWRIFLCFFHLLSSSLQLLCCLIKIIFMNVVPFFRSALRTRKGNEMDYPYERYARFQRCVEVTGNNDVILKHPPPCLPRFSTTTDFNATSRSKKVSFLNSEPFKI